MNYYTELDLPLTLVFILIILVVGYFIRIKNRENPLYKFFIPGLVAKMTGALSLCWVYTNYYKYGGDTINYHSTAMALVNLLFKNPIDFLYVWLGESTPERLFLFNEETGYPVFWNDINAYNVARLIVPLEIITFKSFPATALLMSVIGFTGLWKLYLLFCELYPSLSKHLSLSILFLPSVAFWGSGILKDSFTISAACWYCYSFYKIFIARKISTGNILLFGFSILIMIAVKPYVFVALLPGSILWGISGTLKKIKNILLKIALGPLIAIIGVGLGTIIWFIVGPNLGRYSSLDSMIDKAYEAQLDLKQDYYQGNSFDIGEFEKTPSDIMRKFPEATMAGLFRPFIWEAKNIQMIVSGLENLFVLGFTLFFIIRVPLSFLRQLIENPLVTFCVVFSVMFAFAVGISTSNFGALVRFKIPLWPFFMSALFIINHHRIKYKLNSVSEHRF